MSDDEEKKPPKLHVVRDEKGLPRVSAKLSEEQAKQLFMASPHLEWTTWSKSMGWRHQKPMYDDFQAWSKEKKDILAREQAESIGEALFAHHSRWHTDVMKTLREYPEAADAMMGILKRRVNDIIQVINDDDRQKQYHMQAGTMDDFRPKFNSIDNGELGKLANAIRLTTDTKHRSLMIDRWTIKGTEKFIDPTQFESPQIEDQTWRVSLYNDQQLQANELSDMMARYYDKPVAEVIDVEADDGSMETT